MDSTEGHKNGAPYPSRLVNHNIDTGQSDAPPPTSNNEKAVVDTANNLQKRPAGLNGGNNPDQPEQKKQRTETYNEARERAQQRLMEAINIEAQKIHGADAQVFPDHLLQPSTKPANGVASAKRGRGLPRKETQPSINFLVPTPGGDPQPRYVATSPSGTQQPQALTAASAYDPRRLPYPQAQFYTGLPVPQSYPPTFPASAPGPGPGGNQQQQPKQPAVVHTSALCPPYPQAKRYSGPPVPTLGGLPQHLLPLPALDPPTPSVSQLQAPIDFSALRETATPQKQDQPNPSATVPTSGGSQPHPFGHYRSYPEAPTLSYGRSPPAQVSNNSRYAQQAARSVVGAPTPKPKATPKSRRAPRQTTTQPAKVNSPAPTASSSTQQPSQSKAQPVFGAPIPKLGDIQPAGVRTPQDSFFQQGWGLRGLPALTPPKRSGSHNGLRATTYTPPVNSTPLNPPPISGTPSRRILDPMEYRAITESANKAWAAHGTATPAASRSPYPPPQDSEDLQHAGGRTTHTWNPAKIINLQIAPDDRVNEYLTHDQVTQTIQAMINYTIDWDLAFYHSSKLAWFYSDNNGQHPSIAYPIRVSFPATGYTLVNWIFKQAIYPLPLFSQEPTFPQQCVPDEQTLLADLWLCAADLQIPKLQNLALNELDRVRNVSGRMNLTALVHVYKRTTEGSLLRQYLVWQYANRMNEMTIIEPRAVEYYPKEFLMEWIFMLTQMWKSKTGRNDVKIDLNLEDFMVQEMKVV